MYREYFHIRENPFAITPDPRFLFLSRRHREAMAHLMFGMGEGGGFVLLTGEVGTGKTTLCRSLLEQVPEQVDVALILNPRQTAAELVASVCDELGVAYPAGTTSIKALVDHLNRHLLASHGSGRRTILVIDEAQNLSAEVLEQVRLLTNLETATHKLLQIVLIGQPEIHTLLGQTELRQLSQRITARYHLAPLSPEETVAYVQHRLEVAGVKERLFAAGTLRLVHRLSGGVPRLINIVCDRALLGAYAQRRRRVTRAIVRKAAAEVTGQGVRVNRLPAAGLAAFGILTLVLAAGWALLRLPGKTAEVSFGVTAPAPSGAAVEVPRPEAGARPAPPGPPASLGPDGPDRQGPERDAAPEGEGQDRLDDGRSLEDILADGDARTDVASAFVTLFEAWELPQPDLGTAPGCARAESVGLRCLHGRGTWTNLLHYDRPAVLDLVDRDNRRHRVVLTALEEDRATLDFGGRRVTLPLAEVEPYWFGRFTLFWSPPVLEHRVLKEGSTGPDVIWLRARLDRAEGLPVRMPANESPVFDRALHERVVEFQKRHALAADGVVGKQTLLQLNSAVGDPTIPRLNRTGG